MKMDVNTLTAIAEQHKPLGRVGNANGRPEWQQIEDLFEAHRLPGPPWRLRDELVMMLAWARYGEKLDEQLQDRT